MNKLALSALIFGGLVMASGCTINGSGSFDVTWNSTATCRPNSSVYINAQDTFTDEIFDSGAFPCEAGAGRIPSLPLGDYKVWVDIGDASGSVTYAQSKASLASLDFDLDIIAVPLTVDTASFGFTWTLNGAGAATANCSAAGVDGVGIVATLANTQTAWDADYLCEAGSGTSGELYLGTYTIVLDALDSANGSLGSTTPQEEILSIVGSLVDLGNFDFRI